MPLTVVRRDLDPSTVPSFGGHVRVHWTRQRHPKCRVERVAGQHGEFPRGSRVPPRVLRDRSHDQPADCDELDHQSWMAVVLGLLSPRIVHPLPPAQHSLKTNKAIVHRRRGQQRSS